MKTTIKHSIEAHQEGMIAIFPASRKHSAVYNGKTDRVMIGINFYSLL